MLKISALIINFTLFVFLSLSLPHLAKANSEFKPQLFWQRSTEAQNKIVTETAIGSKVGEALALPLDPAQTVFDNGVSTPQVNKNAVAGGINWASWVQYSSPNQNTCGSVFELRHFQAKFNLLTGINPSSIAKVRLKSPYYVGNTFPINDNAYIYFNNNFVVPPSNRAIISINRTVPEKEPEIEPIVHKMINFFTG